MSTVEPGNLFQPQSFLVSPDEPVTEVELTTLPPVRLANHRVRTAGTPSIESQGTPIPFTPMAAASVGGELSMPMDSIGGAASIHPMRSPLVALTEQGAIAEQAYGDWLRKNVLESKWTTPFVTFYAHWLILILLAILVVHGPDGRGQVTITASNAIPDEMEMAPVEIIDTRVVEPEEATTETSEATVDVPMEMAVSEPVLPESLTAAATPAAAAAESNADSEAKESQPATGAVLTPAHAVTEGSFSVWTIPESPDPGEAYKIVIRAKVPDHLEKYPVLDLQGVVVGSDGYRKLIPGSMRGFLPVNRGYVQFEVPIVAADAEINDVVLIRSKMLKEQQKLKIEFF